MRYLKKDYVVGEILDTISLMQLNNEEVPVLDSTCIGEIAESFLFSWNELGDPEANFDEFMKEHLRIEFKYNYKT